jgi:hypothetical protein
MDREIAPDLDPSGFTREFFNEGLLTFLGKVDKKSFVIRGQKRDYVKKVTKRRDTTEAKEFSGCRIEPTLQEKE